MPDETRRVVTIRTPEGIDLPFEVASLGDRLTAFAADLFLVHVTAGILVLLARWSTGSDTEQYGLSAALLLSFLLRNAYFSYFELRWSGTTPGKRRFGLRVVTREAGILETPAILARNLTREMELFLPLTVALAPGSLLPELPGWAALAGSAWLLVFACLPFLSAERLRVGDVLAGTVVVRMPARMLLDDMAEHPTSAPVESALTFTPAQLDVYGIRELQVLEDLLRRAEQRDEEETLALVAERVKKKIAWPRERGRVDPHRFLLAFYRAQRGRLEHKALFGVRQEHKVGGEGGPNGPKPS